MTTRREKGTIAAWTGLPNAAAFEVHTDSGKRFAIVRASWGPFYKRLYEGDRVTIEYFEDDQFATIIAQN
jgi:hypothetical protein